MNMVWVFLSLSVFFGQESSTVTLEREQLQAYQRQLEEVGTSRQAQLSLRNLTLQEQQLLLEVRVARLLLQNAELQTQLQVQLQAQLQAQNQQQQTGQLQARQRLEQSLRNVQVIAVMRVGDHGSARLRVNQTLRLVRDGDIWQPGVQIQVGSIWVDFVMTERSARAHTQRVYLESTEERR
ncbi:hypothetical protein [Aliidiomarina haloalkalitolerans]|uniref:Uncharacterized protein n=1 Tax=Aliidiomarina haloalkalitolerans TaxID=859059 RepID=A0A432VQS9_9GAMM|nr:hypothetical protein [Aliidiomarina haloalkalitolerans]RUO18621.1 hypothetical protein CWE06_10280 [Aliidiomarina haloalkalitolerans]